jgi:hypothetical protein
MQKSKANHLAEMCESIRASLGLMAPPQIRGCTKDREERRQWPKGLHLMGLRVQVISAAVTTAEGSQLKKQIQELKLAIEKLLI